MAPVSKTKSKTQTTTDPGALICASGLLFDAPSVLAQIAADVAEAKDNFAKRSAISSALNAANNTARDAIKAAYLADPFKTRETTRAYTLSLIHI